MDVQQQDRSLSPKRGDEGVQMNYRGFVVATGAENHGGGRVMRRSSDRQRSQCARATLP